MTCPKCSAPIDLDEDEVDEGDPVTCEECGADLKVAGVHPLELEAVDEKDDEDEDFDEDDEDEDDEDFEEEEEEDKEDEWS